MGDISNLAPEPALLTDREIDGCIVQIAERLRDILDCETGKRGPDGWLWTPYDTWSRYAGQGAPGPSASVWRRADQNGVEWSWRIDKDRRGSARTALEAIEAAELAAKESK